MTNENEKPILSTAHANAKHNNMMPTIYQTDLLIYLGIRRQKAYPNCTYTIMEKVTRFQIQTRFVRPN